MPTYLYWGEEDFTIDLAVKRLRKKLLDEDWAIFNHKVLNNPPVKDIIEAISTVPMGFGDVLIEINNLNLFSRKTKAKKDDAEEEQNSQQINNEKDIKELLDLASNLPNRINLLFVVKFPRDSKKKIDKSLKTTKLFEKTGVVQQFDSIKNYDDRKAIPWIKDAAKDQKVNISENAARTLFEIVGSELRKLNSEIKKLATYVGEGNTIKIEHIKELCLGIDNIFLLLELWVTGNRHDAMYELKKILDKDHPVKILATLQTLINQWLLIKLEIQNGKTSIQLNQELGVHPFVIKNAIEKTKKIPAERLSHLRKQLTIYENKIKTGQLPAEMAMEILITM